MRDADLPRPAISLEAAVAITGRSRRTWWRRIEEGAVTKLPADARGRALLALDEVRPAIVLALDDAETAAVVRADMGDAAAQAEVGALFALAAMDAAADAAAGPQAEPKVRGGGGAATGCGQLLAGTGRRAGRCRRHALAWHAARRRL